MSQNVKKNVYFGIFRGPWGGLQWSDWAYLAFQLSSHPYLCTCQIRKQSDKKFLSLNFKPKIWKNILFFHIWGGPGGPLCRNQVNENFRAVRPHHRADICITREKNNCQFFIYGTQYTKMWIFGYSGGPGWPINNRTHLASQASSHLYQSTYKIWKQSDKDFLSYRENDERSADAA